MRSAALLGVAEAGAAAVLVPGVARRAFAWRRQRCAERFVQRARAGNLLAGRVRFQHRTAECVGVDVAQLIGDHRIALRVAVQQIGAAWVKEWVDGMRALGETIYDTQMQVIDLNKHETIGLFEREDDWSSCAYFYLDRAENGLPLLAPVAERI